MSGFSPTLFAVSLFPEPGFPRCKAENPGATEAIVQMKDCCCLHQMELANALETGFLRRGRAKYKGPKRLSARLPTVQEGKLRPTKSE